MIIAALLVVAALGAAYLVSFNHERSNEPPLGTSERGWSQFTSEEIHLSFGYPNNYVATTTHTQNGGEEWHIVTLLPKDYVPPQDGDGPAAISVQVIPNTKNLALDEWVIKDSRSNWQLAEHNGGFGSTTVGYEPGLAYNYSGPYNTSAVAVAHNSMIYLFTGEWINTDDLLYADFHQVLNTVQFVEPNGH